MAQGACNGWRTVSAIRLAFTFSAANALAQQGGSGDADALRLDAISVTATRAPIEAFEYPGMVTVMTRDDVDLKQASSVDDLLNAIPNVEFTGGPRRTGETPSIRGLSGSDLVILIDGARQNLNAAHDGRFFIDPAIVGGVEVLRGPASALYGSGGTGGVIALNTLRAADVLEDGETYAVRVGAGYQTVDREEYASTSFFGRPADGLDLSANIVMRDPGSVRLGDGSELTRADDDILAGLLKATYDFGGGHEGGFSFVSFHNEATEPNVGQGVAGNDLVDKEIDNQTARLSWRFESPSNPLIDLDTQVYYTRSRVDETRLDNNGAGAQGDFLQRDVDTLGFRADNRSRTGWIGNGATTLVYGVEGYRDVQDGALNGGARDGVPDSTNLFGGVFGQADFRFYDVFGEGTGDLAVLPGLRFDYFSSTSDIADAVTDTAVSPRIGASYSPLPWLMVFGNYAHAFRAPSFDEAFLDGVHFQIPIGFGITNRFVANPDLRSQRTRTLEGGIGVQFGDIIQRGDHLELKATRFRTRATDFIDLQVNQPTPFVDCNPFIPGNCDGTTQAINIPKAELEGNEIEARYDSRNARVVFGFSNLDGDDLINGAKLGVLTPAQVTLDLGIKFPSIGAIAGVRSLAAFDFTKVDAVADERPGYVVHDLYLAMVRPLARSTDLRVDLGIDNVGDRAYSRVFNDAFEPGRNFKGRLTLTHRW